MAASQDELGAFQDSSGLPLSNDAHCQRVARLAVEIAHRLRLDARSIHIVSEAAVQHHAVELVGTKNDRGAPGKRTRRAPGRARDATHLLWLKEIGAREPYHPLRRDPSIGQHLRREVRVARHRKWPGQRGH